MGIIISCQIKEVSLKGYLIFFGLSNKSQGVILANLQAYLRNKERPEDFIKQFEKGYCSGIASVWLYAKWLQTQPKDSAPRDDYEWFEDAIEAIVDWDGKRALTEKESHEFERFISHIQYFQNIDEYLPIVQGDLDKGFEDTKNNILKHEYTIASLFTLDQLKKLLRTDDIIQEGKLILVSPFTHATALFRQGNKYFYFDPNSVDGEAQEISTNKVAELIFQANHFEAREPSPLGLKIFSFDKIPGKYPSQEGVLKAINPSLTTRNNSGLCVAADFGDLECVEYFLKEKVNPNLIIKNGFTALTIAALKGRASVIRKLLQNDDPETDVNIKDNHSMTALMWAAYNGYASIVEELLANGANVNEVNNDNTTAYEFAIIHGHFDVFSIIDNFLKDRNLAVDPDRVRNTFVGSVVSASRKNDVEMVQKFLMKMKELNIITSDIIAVAILAAAEKGHVEVLKVLLENFETELMSVVMQKESNRNALMLAAIGNHAGIIEILLNKDIDPNIKDGNGNTALMLAIQKKNYTAVIKLLEHPQVEIPDKTNWDNIILLAANSGNVKVIKRLMEKKVDCSNIAKDVFAIAVKNNHSDISKLFLPHAKVEVVNSKRKLFWSRIVFGISLLAGIVASVFVPPLAVVIPIIVGGQIYVERSTKNYESIVEKMEQGTIKERERKEKIPQSCVNSTKEIAMRLKTEKDGIMIDVSDSKKNFSKISVLEGPKNRVEIQQETTEKIEEGEDLRLKETNVYGNKDTGFGA